MNVVDFDEKYIVSASGDRTIKVKFFILKMVKPPFLLKVQLTKVLESTSNCKVARPFPQLGVQE